MDTMVTRKCDHHSDPFDCPDALIHFSPKFREYGLIIHDGGASTIGIDHCPFCGEKLPKSKRDEWFEELEKMGFDDFDDEKIPASFQTDEWYSKEGTNR
ncbi:hypothetical protein QEH56_24525 [Pelagicoccus enzymogenes]|nr:hypothetical protein [Pelagicoccus enzymogenes]MDQ8201347.1 hypothetical protein [Pelagicoccus enzymogenes]